MRLGRRPYFFAAVGIVCLALLPPTPGEFRWVNIAMVVLSAFWTVVLAIEDLAHTRRHEQSGASP